MTLAPPARADAAAGVAEQPAHVVFIAGVGRSGSTLVDCLLGQADGVFAAGEVRYLWRRGVLENRRCGCGAEFGGCPTWQRALRESGVDVGDAAGHDRRQRRWTRVRSLGMLVLLPRPLRRRLLARDVGDVAEVYRALVSVTGDAHVVDSSKLPSFALVLVDLPGVDVDVVHLVRDPRATAYSWQRWRGLPDVAGQQWMHRRPALQSALLWTFWNAVAGTVLRHRARGRYQLLRYEDFVAAPAPTVAALLARVGVPPRGSEHAATPLPADATVLHPTHTVAGNPGRMRQGPVRVVADDEWVDGLSRRDWLVVTLLTWPLLVRYRYPLRRPRRRGAGGGEEV